MTSYRGEKKTMEPEAMVYWQIFVAIFYCRKSVETEKWEKIVDFEVGTSATHQGTELRWLWKSMVVSKQTHNWIQWMRSLWVLASGITDNLCHLQLDSVE